MIEVVLAASASICGVSRAWPQVARIVVHHNAVGVSAATWTTALSATLIWEVLGIGLGIVPTILYNAALAIGQIAVLTVLVRHGSISTWRPFAAASGALITGVATLTVFGRAGISVLGVAIAAYMFLPQAIKVTREPSTGVSLPSWLLAAAATLLWCAYGIAIGEPALIASGAMSAPTAIFVIWRVAVARKTGRQHSAVAVTS